MGCYNEKKMKLLEKYLIFNINSELCLHLIVLY